MTTRSRMSSDSVQRSSGRVKLVGAGPGDPDLLTLKAVKAMRAADIILFDALVSEEILAFARSNVKRMLVGKRGHRPSCRQEDINALMLKLARQGKHVVRLKCGDAVLFGRAGEEIAYLEATEFIRDDDGRKRLRVHCRPMRVDREQESSLTKRQGNWPTELCRDTNRLSNWLVVARSAAPG